MRMKIALMIKGNVHLWKKRGTDQILIGVFIGGKKGIYEKEEVALIEKKKRHMLKWTGHLSKDE